jgi:hypothetical protein
MEWLINSSLYNKKPESLAETNRPKSQVEVSVSQNRIVDAPNHIPTINITTIEENKIINSSRNLQIIDMFLLKQAYRAKGWPLK